MINGVIQSEKTKKRKPALSLFLSLFFPGLGQIYNGDILKGLTLYTIGRIPILLIPFYVVLREQNSYICIFVSFTITGILIYFATAIEALTYPIKNRITALKKYNSLLFYSLFSFVSTILTLFAIIVVTFFFTVKKITTEESLPSIQQNEYVLIKKYYSKGYNLGDLILYGLNSTGRILAITGTLKHENNALFINDQPLKYSIYTDKEMSYFREDIKQYIISEENNGIIYPIAINLTIKDKYLIKQKSEEGSLLVCNDNRVEKLNMKRVMTKNILGRIEGIIFATTLNRFFMKPYTGKSH